MQQFLASAGAAPGVCVCHASPPAMSYEYNLISYSYATSVFWGAAILAVLWLVPGWVRGCRRAGRRKAMLARFPALPSTAARDATFAELREDSFLAHRERLGGADTFRWDGFGTLATMDPAVVAQLLHTREHTVTRSFVYKIGRWIPGLDGILLQEGAVWRRATKAVMPVFHERCYGRYAEQIYDLVVARIGRWRAGGEEGAGEGPGEEQGEEQGESRNDGGGVDLLAEMRGIARDIVIRLGYGLDPESPLADDLITLLDSSHVFDSLASKSHSVLGIVRALFTMRRDSLRLRAVVQRMVAAKQAAEAEAAAGEAMAPGAMASRTESGAAAGPGASARGDGVLTGRDASRETRDATKKRRRTRPGANDDWLTGMLREEMPLNEMASQVNHLYGAHRAIALALTFATTQLSRPRNREWTGKLRREFVALAASRKASEGAGEGGGTGGEEEGIPRSAKPFVRREDLHRLPLARAVFKVRRGEETATTVSFTPPTPCRHIKRASCKREWTCYFVPTSDNAPFTRHTHTYTYTHTHTRTHSPGGSTAPCRQLWGHAQDWSAARRAGAETTKITACLG